MALQQINWAQIDTQNVPSGSSIILGKEETPISGGYFENLYISGQNLTEIVVQGGDESRTRITALENYTSSLNDAIETTGSNLTIKGDLSVLGTYTSIKSEVVTFNDNVIELNGGESSFGGLLVKDITSPNTISGSFLWDTTNDKWIGGPLGQEEGFIQDTQFNNFSSSVAVAIEESGIWRPTGSYYATANDLQVTGSLVIRGDLRVEGQTILQSQDPNTESLIISGAMSIVQNRINEQIRLATLSIENLGVFGDQANNSVIDLGGFG